MTTMFLHSAFSGQVTKNTCEGRGISGLLFASFAQRRHFEKVSFVLKNMLFQFSLFAQVNFTGVVMCFSMSFVLPRALHFEGLIISRTESSLDEISCA